MIGKTLLHYEVTAKIGAGGMGEVYRATDTRLGREVAIKVLPAEVTGSEERLARFRREARVLAALNHPGIASIYGLEETRGQSFLVLELVEGEDLQQRLERGAIPVGEALEIARQIAESLEEAHEKGIVHRDLKPANVKLTPDEKVKVLDFGLAKAFVPEAAAEPAGSDFTKSPTLAARGTAAGVILGTAAYMAPEQARGKAVDKRADVWAFGAVLFEMLTGERPFSGADVTDTLASILRSEPRWEALPSGTPQGIRRLVRRCLRKDPTQRLRDIGDARLELTEPPVDAAEGLRHRPSNRLSTWLGAFAGLIAGAGLVTALRPSPIRSSEARSATSIDLPPERALAPVPLLGVDSPKLAVSPDGRRIVYAGEKGDGTALFLRDLGDFELAEVPGTDGAVYPFFSNDGLSLGFLTNEKVKKVSLDGSPPITLGDVQSAIRAVWSADDVIYLVENIGQTLLRVPASGGAQTHVADLFSVFPRARMVGVSDVLEDGSAALATVWSRGGSGDYADIYLLPLDTLEPRLLVPLGYDGRFLGQWKIVFARGGSLFAVDWDRERSGTSGEPRAVVSGVRMESIVGQAQYSASATGTLAYVPGEVFSFGQLARVDRSGQVQLLDVPERTYTSVSVAPDGRRVALSVADVDDYVWIYDVERGEGRKLTEGTAPLWSSDGRAVAFSAVSGDGAWQILSQPAEGVRASQTIHTSETGVWATSWSADGRTIAFYQPGHPVGFARLDGSSATRAPGDSYELFPSFSPDGRWVAFNSRETGRWEVWIRSFPDGSTERQLSVNHGIEPVWCENGELFYRSGRQWMVTSVTTDPELSWEPPRPLFSAEFIDTPHGTWDVSPDGRYVYLLRRTSEEVRTRLHVVTHAFGERRPAERSAAPLTSEY